MGQRNRKNGPKSHDNTRVLTIPNKGLKQLEKRAQRKDAPIWRLTDEEYKLKREKSLCFKCDEKFTFGHRCPRRELRVLAVYADKELEIESAEIEEEIVELMMMEMVDYVELSWKFVHGLSSPKIMKVKGEFKDGQ